MVNNPKSQTGYVLITVLLFYLKNSESFFFGDRLNLKNGYFNQNKTFAGQSSGQHAENERIDQVFVIRENYTDSSKFLLIDDMIISKDPSRAGLLNAAWPSAIVPFTFALTIVPQQRVLISQAMAELASRTCIQFRPARQDDAYWVIFQNDPLNQGCSSFVGWQNRKNQPVQLSTQCSKYNAVHEMIHALGFFHEQTRNDRDQFVIINYQNINPGYENNFKKESDMDPPPETTTYGIPYNYESIMHYGKTFFSKNGQPTIEPLNNPAGTGNGDKIGQREYLSAGDVAMLNKKYNCPTLENPAGEELPLTTVKPNLNPMCQFSPMLPMCKQNDS